MLLLTIKSIAGAHQYSDSAEIWTARYTVWNATRDPGSSGSYARDLSRDLCFAEQTGEKEKSHESEGRLSGR